MLLNIAEKSEVKINGLSDSEEAVSERADVLSSHAWPLVVKFNHSIIKKKKKGIEV